MKKYLNTSGSYWRKWDLHIHSPDSILHSEYSGNWDLYIETLESLTDISVIGITDYFSIEGYKKVIEQRNTGRLSNIDLVIPNIELRLDKTTHKGAPINLHILFDPELQPEIIERYFLSELEFIFKGSTYKCINSDLENLGEIFLKEDEVFSHEKALKEGMKQFKVSIEGIDKILKKHTKLLNNKYLIVLPNSNTDGNSGLRDDSFLAVRREIYHFAHAIFSSNPRDREFFLGKHNYKNTIEQCGKLMPCIHGSDAHSFDRIGKPDNDRFTWIKSEPTFEGLKQIVHEPSSRVLIQPHHPDQKNNYDVISSISFKSATSDFSDREIKLNPGLNTIIGGKSSGKSLLLYKIAQSISKHELDTREQQELWRNPYKGTFIEEAPFEVKWRNGSVTSNISDEQIGKVTYIPQMYINTLSEDTANHVLQDKILSILLQDPSNQFFMKEKQEELQSTKRKTAEAITRLDEVLQKKKSKELEIIKIGDENAILMEIEKLKDDMANKLSVSELTELEEKHIKEKELIKDEVIKKIDLTRKMGRYNQGISKELNIIYDQVNESLKQIDRKDEFFESSIDNLRQKISEAFIEIQNNIQERVSSLNNEKEKFEHELVAVQDSLKPLITKTKNMGEIQLIKSKCENEEQNLIQIKTKKEELKVLEEQLIHTAEELVALQARNIDINQSIIDYFNQSKYLKDISIDVKFEFRQDAFDMNFMNKFSRRGKVGSLFPGCAEKAIFSDDESFIFNKEDFAIKIEFLLKSILENNDLKLKKGTTKINAIQSLFADYNEVIFDLKKDNDALLEMSPGKRGLVLLELFLNISNESHPILIDQPEDNLDNRTITTDLVKFITEKSLNRQIIIVTHNANLVVLTDSENVIIANQDPMLLENEEHRFEYINGAIECDFHDKDSIKIKSKGIKSHICEILEGGADAFTQREKKYGF